MSGARTETAPHGRWRHMVPAALLAALAVTVAWISFSVEDPEPYLFPRMVSAALVVLAGMALAQAAAGKAQYDAGLNMAAVRNILPGLMIMAAFVFWGIEFLGMYAASTAAFLAVAALYDPAPHHSARAWAVRIAATAVFMAVMYGLFALVLKVQAPRGLFI
ncbi:MAG: tripartite tricarboxylate transporter TctB family protein [Rhodospirillales bacterium]